MNSLIRDYRLLLRDSGINLINSFEDALATAKGEEKLLLIHFHDPQTSENKFLNILINTDINSLFKTDFVLHVPSVDEPHIEFYNLIHGEPDDVANQLYVIGVQQDSIDHVSTICVANTPEAEILYELYRIHESFQDEIMKTCDNAASECSQLYKEKYAEIVRNLNYVEITLKDALINSMDQPVSYMKKIVMLYMYKDGSELSTQFNQFLLSGEMKKFAQLFTPIFWDISEERHHKSMKLLCQSYFDQDLLENTVWSDKGGVFFFRPDEGTKDGDMKLAPRVYTSLTCSDVHNKKNFIKTLNHIFSRFQTTHRITIMNEIEAIDAYHSNSSIFEDFIERYSLHDVEEICLQKRKMLLLYFHTPLSKLQNTLPQIKDIMVVNQIALVPWSVNNTHRNAVLEIALQRTFGLKKIEMMLKAKKSALFIFVPIGGTLVLHSVVEEDASVSSITKTYKAAHKFFIMESQLKNNDNEDSGPAAYQQILCDQLQDRDFDCFQLDKDEGNELKKKIAFAYFGPPSDESGEYKADQRKKIETAYQKISGEAAKHGEDKDMLYISFMRVCITPLPKDKNKKGAKDDTYQPSLDFYALPLFGIRKCFDCPKDSTACRIYIDHIGRIYQNWEDFIKNNKYPKVMLIAPKNGRYSTDYRGKVQLEVCPSPACGIGVAILKGVDIGVSIAGGIAGIVGIVTTSSIAVPVLPIVALGVGVYSIVRSGMTIAERSRYGESLRITQPEARGAYLNIIAGSLGFTTAGASFAMAYMARTGVAIGTTTKVVFNGITIANMTAGGTAMGNSVYDVIVQWTEDGKPNTLAIIQLTSSILFFGHAVYNTQFAGTIIENSQATTIQKVLDSLSSNRQRKTIINMINTTAEQTGSTTTANAEVIRYIRNLDNISEVVAVLTRDTEMMSRNGVNYSVDNGKILFNGVEMNVSEFGNMSKVQRHEMITSISGKTFTPRRAGTPVKSSASTRTTLAKMENFFKGVQAITPLIHLAFTDGAHGVGALRNLMAQFSPFVQELLMLAVDKFIAYIGMNSADLQRSITSLFPAAQVPLIILEKLLQLYWLEDVHSKIPEGCRDKIDDVVKLMEKAVMSSTMSIQRLLIRLTTYCTRWIMEVNIDKGIEAAANTSPREKRSTQVCKTCGGKLYKFPIKVRIRSKRRIRRRVKSARRKYKF